MDTELDFLKDLEKVLKLLDTPLEFITTEEVERKFPKYGKPICKYLGEKGTVNVYSFQLKGKKDGQIRMLLLETRNKIKKEEDAIKDRKRQTISYYCNILITLFTGGSCVAAIVFGLLNKSS